MEFARLEYEEIQEGATDKKGCFARLFVEVKKEKIKSINRVGKSGHTTNRFGTICVKVCGFWLPRYVNQKFSLCLTENPPPKCVKQSFHTF